MAKIIGNTIATPYSQISSVEGLASTEYVDNTIEAKISEMVDSAPETLDTLNELAAALGDDPNFATTVLEQIGQKADETEIKDYIDEKEKNYVDLTSEQTIYAKKTFMSPITVCGNAEVQDGSLSFWDTSSGYAATIGMDKKTGHFQLGSTAFEMWFNNNRVLTDVDKAELVDGLVQISTDVAMRAHMSDIAELKEKKADKTEVENRLAQAEGTLDVTANGVNYLENTKADKDATEWQLVESVTLEQDVQTLACDLKGGNYKELYIRFIIPTLNPDKVSDFPKGRVQVLEQGYTYLFDEGASVFVDNEGKDWLLTYHLTMVGNNCIGERKIYEDSLTHPYAINYNPNRWSHSLGTQLENNFISTLRFKMLPTDTWKFPAGTTYELWGVKA